MAFVIIFVIVAGIVAAVLFNRKKVVTPVEEVIQPPVTDTFSTLEKIEKILTPTPVEEVVEKPIVEVEKPTTKKPSVSKKPTKKEL
jgi:hypothetical protein